jgi:hypothetical protein
MQTSSFNLLTVVAALQKRWTTILFFVVASLAAAAITLYVVPVYYRSSATLVSANPALADKARLFNSNIQGLYSYFGSGDDLDRIAGIADLDTTYKKLVDEFDLVKYYELQNDSLSLLRRKAVLRLRKDLSLQKTDKNQLLIKVWTKDRNLSADLVNRMVKLVEETESRVWQTHYRQAIGNLQSAVTGMETEYSKLSDSMRVAPPSRKELLNVQMHTLLDQLQQYRKTAGEFSMALQTPPAVLYVQEMAVPAAKAERPDKIAILLITSLVSFVFICLMVLVNDRKQPA